MSQKDLIIQKKLTVAEIGEHIGFEEAKKMINRFATERGTIISRNVGRQIIEKILSQPNCAGINITLAIDDNGLDTYVFTGIDEDKQPIFQFSEVTPDGEVHTKEGIIADRIDYADLFERFKRIFW